MKLRITINDTVYEADVEVLDDEDSSPDPSHSPSHAAHSPSGERSAIQGAVWDTEDKVCRSPIVGLAIRVNVQPEQTVEAGALIMVLEAMKMETNVIAPRAGTVKRVHAAQGDSVKLNQVLLELE